tara:strand:+ start:114 stop:953 length:840 start_codon:yes stop_codon:yes gene_type:complete
MPAKTKEITFLPSTIETIDTGIYEWLDEVLSLHTTTNDGFKKVPVLWLGTERAFQIKNDSRIRDKVGKLKLPLITLNRESLAKDPNFKGSFQAHIAENSDYKGGNAATAARTIRQDKTRNFANADKRRRNQNGNETGKGTKDKTVYNTITMPVPTYVSVMYSITLRTEYQQQMNDLVTPFITSTGQINSFLFEKDGHRFEAFIQQDFAENKNANLGEDERMFETRVQIKVLGYLVGEGVNREKPKVTIRENAVQLRISRERVIVGDTRPWSRDDFDYRE